MFWHCKNLAVPGDQPQNLFVVVSSPFAIFVRWEPPLTPNGVITQYTIYIDETPVLSVDGDTHNAVVGSLSSNTMFNVSLSASTKIGEGPISEPEHVTTPESGELL